MIVETLQSLIVALRGGAPLTSGFHFFVGAIADAVSTAFVWPLAFARIKVAVGDGLQQRGGAGRATTQLGRLVSAIARTYHDHGLLRVYHGGCSYFRLLVCAAR